GFDAAASRVVVRCAPPGFYEHVVHDVLCLGFADHDAPRESEHERRVSIVEGSERARVPVRDGANQSFVAFGRTCAAVAVTVHERGTVPVRLLPIQPGPRRPFFAPAQGNSPIAETCYTLVRTREVRLWIIVQVDFRTAQPRGA